MVTADEIAEVTIFAALGASKRERLARAAAGEGSMAIAFVHQYLRDAEIRVAQQRRCSG